ncbi:MAG: flavodoxin family protein [Firmicutes bacterium]|nr:flavodoxin family protein [Bacillota bacterium]
MYVLAVIGSPRKGGNTDVLVDKAIGGARSSGAQVEKVYLSDLDIGPCDACMGCENTGECVKPDDMQDLFPKILRADGLIIGTPVYWWGPTAQTKLFVDRWYSLQFKEASMKGKKMAVIAPYGDDDPATARHVFGMFQDAADYLGVDLVGTCGATANDKGEVASNEVALKRALYLGKLVAAGGQVHG